MSGMFYDCSIPLKMKVFKEYKNFKREVFDRIY